MAPEKKKKKAVAPQEEDEEEAASSEIDESSSDEEEDSENRRLFLEETRSKFSNIVEKDEATEQARDMYVDDLSSDDESDDGQNKTGRVPLHWYEGYDHIGYDLRGTKILPSAKSDLMDAALAEGNDLTVYDKLNGREITLTPREALLARRIRSGAFANPESEMYPDFVDYVSHKKEISSLYRDQYEPKRRFVPSKHEKAKIYKIVQGLKSGRMKTKKALDEEKRIRQDPERIFLEFAATLWGDDDEEIEQKRGPPRLPAPKLALPGHELSYRPPEEYLEEEDEDAAFKPKRHEVMRHVGAYPNLVQERFERCLDLYLCPRGLKRKLDIDPDSLVPKLPDPNDLKPFPNSLCRTFPISDCGVTGLSVSPDGQFVASVDDSGLVVIYETLTSRRLTSIRIYEEETTKNACSDIAWNPNPSHHVLAVACKDRVVFLDAKTARADDKDITAALLSRVSSKEDDTPFLSWENNLQNDRLDVVSSSTKASFSAETIAWHHKGDYAVSVSPLAAPSKQVVVHRCSTNSSQAPLRQKRAAGSSGDSVQAARFHPNKPFLFVATKTAVKIFHLTQQKLVKTLQTGCKWISDIDVHPSGDHVILGSCDKRVSWFDLDLGAKPFKTLRYHDRAVRKTRFHPRFPLFASCADDGDVYVLHATVYADLMKNPLILPVHHFKQAHEPTHSLGVLGLAFHPTQPWLFTAGADRQLRLFHSL